MGCSLLQGTSVLGNLGMGWSGTEEAWPQSPQTKEAWSDGRGGCVGPATGEGDGTCEIKVRTY